MKSFFLILALVFMVGFGYSTQPLRKPFIQIEVDGKPVKNEEVLSIKPGQKLLVGVEMEGGRRDFCKFPDTYADIAGTAQILSRGDNGITYQLDGKNAEWKLLNEDTHFTADEFIQVKTSPNQPSAEITISDKKFPQSYLKITVNAIWQFSENGIVMKEENKAEGTLYFKVAGASDVWFSSPNIQASGIENERIHDKLNEVQTVCDSIEKDFSKLNFNGVQQKVHDLQNAIDLLKSNIDGVKAANPSYQVKVLFIGLPSDNMFNGTSALSNIKNTWLAQQTMLNDKKQTLAKLPAEATNESTGELVQIIAEYASWQNKLPENTFKVLQRHLPDLTADKVQMPGNIRSVAEEKTIANYTQTLGDFNAFLDQRIEQIPAEIQQITATLARLQAVRLFDGMLRSYFSSIAWAEWKDTRE